MDITALKQLLVSGYIWAFVGRVLTAVFGMAVNALLTRILSPDEVGAYFLIVSIVTVLSMLAMFGQQRVIVRIIPDAITKGLGGIAKQGARYSYLIVALATLVIAVIMSVTGSKLVTSLFDSEIISNVVYLAVGLLIVRTASSMLAETFRSFHDIRRAVLFNGALVNIGFSIILLMLYMSSEVYSLRHVLLLSICAYAFNALIAWFLSRDLFYDLVGEGRIKLKELISMGVPLLVTGLTLFVITQADLWIVGYIMEEKDVALYGAAVKLVQLIVIPLLIMNAVLPSIISSVYAKGDLRLLEKVLRTSAMVAGIPALVMLIAVMFVSGDILELLYGEYYRVGKEVLIIIGVGQAIHVLAGAGLMVLMMSGLQVYAMLISMMSGIILLVAGIFATSEYGMEGMATVVSITVALQSIFILVLVRVKVGVWSHIGFSGIFALLNLLKNKELGKST